MTGEQDSNGAGQPERVGWIRERQKLLAEIATRQLRLDYLEALLATEPLKCACPEGFPRIDKQRNRRLHTGVCPLVDEVLT